MLRRCRHSALRVLGMFAALLWAWSLHAGQLHQLRGAHALCLEHVQVVDVPAGHTDVASIDHPGGDSAWATTPDTDHGCVVQILVPPDLLQVVAVRDVRRLTFPVVDPLAAREAPRGPPLDYAPKTSPPALA